MPLPALQEEGSENRIDTVNDLLENGILVETNKGLVCLSLKDALTTGVGGLNLSVEDFQNVAAQLLTQQSVDKAVIDATSLGDVMLNVLPDASQQVVYKEADVGDGNFETVNSSNLEDQLNVTDDSLRPNEKDAGQEKSQARREETEPVVAIVPPTLSVPEPPPNPIQASSQNQQQQQQQKKRGGWPKGRKRKPELSEMRPPKAPATGYVLYLNEKRKQYKDLPFAEVTKLLGNEWSKLSADEKRIYLERAEVEKKRYREELKAYRQSDAYQSYLNRKRTKILQGNGTEESDLDATDEIEDEDNEELYCRTCDQWFSSLHNKKEHLYGKQHLQAIAGDFTKERLAAEQDGLINSSSSHSTISLDDSSLDGTPSGRSSIKGGGRIKQQENNCAPGPSNMTDAIMRVVETSAEREREIKILDKRLQEVQANNARLMKELSKLKELETRLQECLECEKELGGVLDQKLYNLWAVPTLVYMNPQIEQDPNTNIPVLVCLSQDSWPLQHKLFS
ncbi:hypothetical protein L9F63_023564 [Diploptera punctata]|uniref:HMG box domain-containing protein n=1 Tax=Diploptera punctata TaxID=6984 RepID=A0AAD7ZJY5_DIPPU|nr:hypothetical protein L9F63_023564 [Diploptera punctata]